MINSFDCVMPHQPPIMLILGSLPSVTSLGQQQYYAHPRNAFWRIIEILFANGAILSYPARVALLQEQRIALWDVIASAQREGSLDSQIDASSVVPNDIVGLLSAYPSIQTIYCNGGMATTLFQRHIAPDLSVPVRMVSLPSTSPANARMSFETKLARWQVLGNDTA